jgi:predicted nuclease of predicted toxin-antitoxin system
MRFLVDECTGPYVARWLRAQDHEVFSVYESARGMDDDEIIHKACEEDWILITNDKDFGAKVYKERYPHHGVVLLRLEDERSSCKVEALRQLLNAYAEQLRDHFVVVTEDRIRVAGR